MNLVLFIDIVYKTYSILSDVKSVYPSIMTTSDHLKDAFGSHYVI